MPVTRRTILKTGICGLAAASLASNPLSAFAADPAPAGKKIKPLRRLWHDDKGENFMFDGCVLSVLRCLNAPKELDYNFVSGVSGNLFTQVYNPDASVNCLTDDCFTPEMADRIFHASGYAFSHMADAELAKDPQAAMKRVIASIDRGVPVITRGIGPIPVAKKTLDTDTAFALIGGYEPDGTLYVNVYQEDAITDSAGYITVKAGLQKSKGLLIAGEKTQAPPLPDVYRAAVLAIPGLIAKPAVGKYTFGRQAFLDWADGILKDEFYAKDSPDMRWQKHNAPLCILATSTGRDISFLQRAQQLCPDLAPAKALIPLYQKIADLTRGILGFQGNFFVTHQQMANRDFRQSIADRLRDLAECCDEILAVF